MCKIKLVHVVGNLGFGGAERFVIDLCNEIAKNEHYEVAIVSLCEDKKENLFIRDIAPNVRYLSFHKAKGFSLNTLLRLTAWLKKHQPDVVHTHLNSSEYLALYRLLFTRALFFHTIHNVAEVECPSFLIKSFRYFFYKIKRVIPITISDNGRKTYRDYYRLTNDLLIENGRPPLRFTGQLGELSNRYRTDKKNAIVLVHVGRISAEKNQLLLIKAVQYFNTVESIKCKLLIIGQVQDDHLYKRLLLEVSNDTQIEFLGGRDNVADYLGIADVFCLSSEFEGMPISLIESFSTGCVSVCTPVGGIPQMIQDSVTGFLSKDLSVSSYYDALKHAVEADRDTIAGNVIKQFHEKYHIRISADKHLKAYTGMLRMAEQKKAPFYFHTSQN
jgi:glycosyltransferase involved in cell wall biosynthesis